MAPVTAAQDVSPLACYLADRSGELLVNLHNEADVASVSFPELVEQSRRATNDVCEKAKLILRRVLPSVEALQKDNANFSPRLMLLMLSRTGEELSAEDRQRIHDALQHA